jgi:hypothetical protein
VLLVSLSRCMEGVCQVLILLLPLAVLGMCCCAGAWVEMRETWARQQQEPGFQFDTPVPTPTDAKTAQALAESKLASAMGDIAPSTLA